MADELVFYTNPMSRGRIMRWMLEETGSRYPLPYRGARVGHDDEGGGVPSRGQQPAVVAGIALVAALPWVRTRLGARHRREYTHLVGLREQQQSA